MSWRDRIRSPKRPLRTCSVRLDPETWRKLDVLARQIAIEHGVPVSRSRAIDMVVESYPTAG